MIGKLEAAMVQGGLSRRRVGPRVPTNKGREEEEEEEEEEGQAEEEEEEWTLRRIHNVDYEAVLRGGGGGVGPQRHPPRKGGRAGRRLQDALSQGGTPAAAAARGQAVGAHSLLQRHSLGGPVGEQERGTAVASQVRGAQPHLGCP